VCVARLHTGVVPAQPAFATQPTQAPGPMSHAGVAPVHRLVSLAEHWPHAPPGWHAGVAPPHSPLPAQPRQVWLVPSQIGVLPPHWAAVRHATQVPVGVWHSGVVPAHAVPLAAEHWPQAPPGWHAGVVPPHSPSPAQPRQAWNTGSQTGVAPEQSLSARHATHVPDGAWQIGVAPPHLVVLPAEH
jgi:hypothetical protein